MKRRSDEEISAPLYEYRNLSVKVRAIYDENGESVESAPHPQQKLAVDLGTEIEKYDLLRRAEASEN